jgi:histidinol-phosphatase
VSETFELDRLLAAAERAAERAKTIARRWYESGVEVELKADQTPVTEADRECEQAIRAVLKRAAPEIPIYGEEFGRDPGGDELLWLVDPIDGTKAFVRGYPFFSTQIALKRGAELVLGVSALPVASGGDARARRERPAYLNGAPVKVSAQRTIDGAHLSTGNLKSLAADPSAWARFGAIVPRLGRIRGYGDYLHYHLLASGKLDAVIESDVNILDIAALSVIVEQAGGIFSDLHGAPLNLKTTSVLAAATPELHAALLDALHSP